MSFIRPTNGQSTGGQDVVSLPVNENVTKGDVLRSKIAGAHGMLEKANDAGTHCVGVALESCASCSTSIVGNICITPGQIMPLNFGSDLTSGDTGKAVYLSTTNGRATLTAPSATGNKVVRVGYVWDGSANIGTTGIHSVVFQPQFITEIS